MQNLTPEGLNLVNDIAQRYNLSQAAVIHMLVAVNNGGGTMAQFNCPELGGSGQWMRGGMTMVGDMFNYGLKMTVDNLCNELANGLANMQVFPPVPRGTPGSNQWWPQDLGSPFSSGSQNNIRYAIFPNRLAVELNGAVTVYDTLDHQIGGVSQQQGGNTSLTFSSQYGTVSVSSLPIVSGKGLPPAPQTNFAAPSSNQSASNSQNNAPPPASQNQSQSGQPLSNNSGSNNFDQNSSGQPRSSASANEILSLIEKLASLHSAGALTDDEFYSKKNELLSRL
ncbi:MAG: SHOCT domain-containing protein [Gammaproteobacteria bacterium]|uniref:SHOCT domain-containing protein n=1 Tax=Pseudomaricurvus alcaniphilus TaxID=1166482 RepID=UPI00140D6098|nr:SHOCT domain-containing protein [Pseudomaricurvus alcaniphilus]MBR9910514.1 SHOCT domain-containing protein [Gammaproteobacteria bacterium]NHN39687.1 SHOCT domain-containing protein [Pseudomaricurvus alcaniphilus]